MAASSSEDAMRSFMELDIQGPESLPPTYEDVMALVEESGLNSTTIYKLKQLAAETFLSAYGKYVYKFRAEKICNTLNPVDYKGLLLFLRNEVRKMMKAFEARYAEIERGLVKLQRRVGYILDIVPNNFAISFHEEYGDQLQTASKRMSGARFLTMDKEILHVNILNDCRHKGWFNRMTGVGMLQMIPGARVGDFKITLELKLHCLALNYSHLIRRLAEDELVGFTRREWRQHQKRRFYRRDFKNRFQDIIAGLTEVKA